MTFNRGPLVRLLGTKPGGPYYYALRRVVGARRTFGHARGDYSDEYVAAVCAEAAAIKEQWGPWPPLR